MPNAFWRRHYLDRVCISVAAPSMSAELGLTSVQMGYVFSVFALSYGIFEIPMGWFGDRFGQRRLMAPIVAAWSLLTVLTGLVRGYAALLFVRILFGRSKPGHSLRSRGRWRAGFRSKIAAGPLG